MEGSKGGLGRIARDLVRSGKTSMESALSSDLSSRRVEQQEVEGGWGAGDRKSCVVDPGPFGLCRGPREAYVLGCAKVVGHVGLGIRLPRFKSRPYFQS